MSTHVRLQIRTGLVTSLNALSDLTNHVFVNRTDPFQDNELPAVLLLVGEEKIERLTQNWPCLMARHMTVQIDILAKLANGFDDVLENWATQIEVALASANPLPGLTIKDLVLQAVAKGKPNGEGQDDLINLRLEYLVEAQTRENDPTTLV